MSRAAEPRIVHLNGAFIPFEDARIPIMDRGFLFGDGIYEVTAVLEGRLIDNGLHLARLDRSLAEIGIVNPHSTAGWTALQAELVRRNRLDEGLVYIEVTRGVHEREFTCPPEIPPTVVMFTQQKPVRNNPQFAAGAAIITVPDLRWARRDIKSVALLAQVLAKREAKAAGVAEAWMVEDGLVTEGASSTAFIVTEADEIITRPLSRAVLPGITRMTIMQIAEERGLTLVERPFSVAEVLAAREAFYTSASTMLMPVVTVDGNRIGGGQPGPVARALRQRYIELVLEQPRDVA